MSMESNIFQAHDAFLVSTLRSTLNHTPLKCRFLFKFKMSNQIRPAYAYIWMLMFVKSPIEVCWGKILLVGRDFVLPW